MRCESHHFELIDPVIRAVTIDLYDEYATIAYFLNLPYLEKISGPISFTASYQMNYLNVDLENRDGRIVAKISPDQALLAIDNYSKIARSHTVTTSDV